MPWKETVVMEERFRLIERWKESEESISDLAKRFEVSRKTGAWGQPRQAAPSQTDTAASRSEREEGAYLPCRS